MISPVIPLVVFRSGGGGDNISPQPMGAITEANAQDVTSSVLSAAVEVVDLIEIANVIGLPGVPPPNQGIVSGRSVGLPGLSLAGASVQDIITETVPCDSGQFTVTWDDADNDMEVSTGDTFDIVFEDCFFAIVDVTLNGSISIADIPITGDAINEIAPWSVAATFVFDNLRGTDAIDTATIDGDLTLAMSSDDNVVLDVSVSTTALTVIQSPYGPALSAVRRNIDGRVIGSEWVRGTTSISTWVVFTLPLAATPEDRVAAYKRFIGESMDEEQSRIIGQSIERGQITGTFRLARDCEQRLGVRISMRGPGRPRLRK